MAEINFIDLFAGASGLSEGFVRAGFNPIAHIEMNKEACDTIRTRAVYHYLASRRNLSPYYSYLKGSISRAELYSKVPSHILDSVINIEISDDTIDDIFNRIEKISSSSNQIDMIIGGPPCQAYSLLGRHRKEMENDPRTLLYIQYGKFLKRFNPRVFVFENVPGLLSSKKGQHFSNLREYFNELGYSVHYQMLDASNFGVLQARKRVIIVGWRKEDDLGFPILEKQKLTACVNDILSDLPHLKPGDSLPVARYLKSANNYLKSSGIRNSVDFVTQHIARPHNANDLTIYRYAIEKWVNNNVRVKYADLPDAMRTQNNIKSFLDRFKVVNGTGVSHTVVAHIAKDGHYYIHPDISQCRSISVREAARIQSFPDDFYFEGSRSAAFKQIGNAVPPVMAYAIALKIKDLLCQKKNIQ